MKTRIIFWVVPVMLAAIIVVVFYQISLEERESLSTSLEQGLREEPEKDSESEDPGPAPKEEAMIAEATDEMKEEGTESTPEAAPEPTPPEKLPTAPLMKTKSEGDSSSGVKEMVKTQPMQEASQEKSGTAKTGEMQSSKLEKTPAKEGSSKKFSKPSEQAALVETPNELWNIVAASKKENDLSQWQTIIIQNKQKLDYTILPKRSSMSRIVKSDKKLRVQLTEEMDEGKDILSRKNKGKYAVQLLSIERKFFNRAINVVQDLVHDGYYAYLHRTNEKFENKHWFRVRVGFFKTAEEAQTLGEEIYFRYRDEKALPKNYWAVLPSPRELNNELVDFQTQQNKPWVLELPEYTSQQAAIQDLPDFMEIADFAYLSYRVEDEKTIQYRIRLGFFETKAEANQHLKQLRRVRDELGKAKSVKL